MARSASLQLLRNIVRVNLESSLSGNFRSGFVLEAAQASQYAPVRSLCSILHFTGSLKNSGAYGSFSAPHFSPWSTVSHCTAKFRSFDTPGTYFDVSARRKSLFSEYLWAGLVGSSRLHQEYNHACSLMLVEQGTGATAAFTPP